MIEHNTRKNSNNSKNSKKEQEKKQKNSIMKKLLNPNKIVSILSHQPRKLMKLAKKGNLVYKNLQQHALLPKLTLKNLFPEIEDLNITNQIHQEQFQVVNKQLTCSMINFQHKFTAISQQDEGKILNLQTQKCYSHIPSYFFNQLTQQQIQKILTRNKLQAKQKTFDYIDYSDEVQYNINQQVGYKMKVFMQFAFFLQGIAGLVDISCKKIQGSRTRNNILRQIIVQKSTNINILRVKQHNLNQCIKIVNQLKKIKNMEKSVMSLIHAKGKIGVNQFYEQYCKQHSKIKQFCCKKGLCSFGDIKYYVQRNYQDTFNKSLQNYLTQMTKIDKKKLYQILKPTKNAYMSMNFQNKNNLVQKSTGKGSFNLDQSIEIEDQFELITKNNIEKEISSIFQLGIMKCTYSTDNLCLYLKDQLHEFQINIYSSILANTQKPKQDLLDNFVNYALNKPSHNSLQLNIDDKLLSFVEKSQIINKIPIIKFYQILQLTSKQLVALCTRCFSIINELMKILKQIQMHHPQKEEIISAYLIQLVIICINSSDLFLGTFINLKQVKQSQIQISDRVINICQQWQQFIDQIQNKYESLWRKLIFHLSDKPYNNVSKTKKIIGDKERQIQSSFKCLEQFVKNNYSDQSQKEVQQFNQDDISEQLLSKKQMQIKLIPQIINSKNIKICFNFYALSKMIVSKQLTKRIQAQTWLPVSMNSNIQKSTGFILYGNSFLNRQQSQNDSKNFLSKSLLLDKSHLGYKRKSDQSIPPPPQERFPIQTTEKLLKLGQKSYKLIGVSEYMLQVIYLFLIYLDKYEFIDQNNFGGGLQKQNIPQKSFQPQKINFILVLQKVIEVILIFCSKVKYYVNNYKELQKKVKSFAKFLLLVYVQLDFFKSITISVINDKLQKRRFEQNNNSKNQQKHINEFKKTFLKQIDQCMNQILKKYNSVGYQKIKQSIKKLDINPKKEIKIPSQTTSQILNYFSKSLQIIQDIIIDKTQFWKFLNCNWIKIYLQRVNQQYSIIRKYVLKSNGSGTGRRVEEIEWQDKLDWKTKQLKWIYSAMESENYTQHIKDIGLIEDQINKNK